MRVAARSLCLIISTGFDKIALVFSLLVSCLLLVVVAVEVEVVIPFVVIPFVVPFAFVVILDFCCCCFIGEVFKKPEDVFRSKEGTTQPCETLSRRCDALDMHVGASTPYPVDAAALCFFCC